MDESKRLEFMKKEAAEFMATQPDPIQGAWIAMVEELSEGKMATYAGALSFLLCNLYNENERLRRQCRNLAALIADDG